jgi:hypothetical protein
MQCLFHSLVSGVVNAICFIGYVGHCVKGATCFASRLPIPMPAANFVAADDGADVLTAFALDALARHHHVPPCTIIGLSWRISERLVEKFR